MYKEVFRDYFGFPKENFVNSPIVITSEVEDGDMLNKKVRADFLVKNGIDPKDFVLMATDHSSQIVEIADGDFPGGITADAVILNKPKRKLVLGLLAADCLPIEIVDPGGAIALVHAGWKELDQEIVGRTINRMVEEHGSDPESILMHFGPAICREHYEVGSEVSGRFRQHVAYRNAISSNREKDLLDLSVIAKAQAFYFGVRKGNIIEDLRCTFEDKKLFSHRRSTKTNMPEARFINLFVLNPAS